jgi:hypothetical protein
MGGLKKIRYPLEPSTAGVVASAGGIGPEPDIGIGGKGGIGLNRLAGGFGQGRLEAGGTVEQPDSSAAKARAANSKAMDCTGSLLSFDLTGGFGGGDGSGQLVAALDGGLQGNAGQNGAAFTLLGITPAQIAQLAGVVAGSGQPAHPSAGDQQGGRSHQTDSK